MDNLIPSVFLYKSQISLSLKFGEIKHDEHKIITSQRVDPHHELESNRTAW